MTDLRELRVGLRLSALGVLDGVVSSPGVLGNARGVESSSASSKTCSTLVTSESTLASSSKLVGGVELEGDALDIAQILACLSVCTVIFDRVDDVDAGEMPLSAMLAKRVVVDRVVIMGTGGETLTRGVEPRLRRVQQRSKRNTAQVHAQQTPDECGNTWNGQASLGEAGDMHWWAM